MKKTIYKDPVCGRKLNRQKAHIAIDYEGITYYLCCPRCQREFEADPKRYARPEFGYKTQKAKHERGRNPVKPYVEWGDTMTPQIKKRSGRTEEFSRPKLESSLRRAGAFEQIARELTSQLTIREGMSTSELRSQVLAALRTKDSEAAERYERTRCCRAKSSSEIAPVPPFGWSTAARRIPCGRRSRPL